MEDCSSFMDDDDLHRRSDDDWPSSQEYQPMEFATDDSPAVELFDSPDYFTDITYSYLVGNIYHDTDMDISSSSSWDDSSDFSSSSSDDSGSSSSSFSDD